MAESQETYTFEENPKEFCRDKYSVAKGRNDDLAPVNKENRLFYEGIDAELLKRAEDKDVQRSSLFIHELKPAIDTRKSDVITKLEEREYPITVRPSTPTPTEEEKGQATWIERKINDQLRECGYLSDGFGDHILAAEIYRSPAAVKVGWEPVYEKKAEAFIPTEKQVLEAVQRGELPPEPTVNWVTKYEGGRPYVDLLAPDEFLYEPNISSFQRDSEFACHAVWVSWNKLMAMAKEQEWDTKVIEKFKREIEDADDPDSSEGFEKDVQDEKDVPWKDGYRDGHVLVAEFYISTFEESGADVINRVVMVGNHRVVKKEVTPYRGIRFPFVPVSANRFPGTIEGLSSVDVAKMMQRLYNELFNSFLDGVSYRMFPPLVQEPGTEFQEKPKWGVGQIWKVSNPDGLRPLIENPGVLPDLPSLMEAVSGKIRDVLNAQDISQGFQSQEYEKATATKARTVGSAKRAMPTHKRYGEALIEVAKMVLALNQQYAEDKVKYVLDVIVDVPSLTNISDPENEKQESLLLLSQAEQSPIYQSPVGQLKVRNLYKDVYRKFKRIDIDAILPSEEELKQFMQSQTELEVAGLEKQSAQEQMAAAGGGSELPVQ